VVGLSGSSLLQDAEEFESFAGLVNNSAQGGGDFFVVGDTQQADGGDTEGAGFCGAVPGLPRRLSLPNVTSRTQCERFSRFQSAFQRPSPVSEAQLAPILLRLNPVGDRLKTTDRP
jgi:hypothetical protein